MAHQSRRQLLVLFLLVAAGGGGLAVGRWRRANPETVEYVERLDRASVPPASVSAPEPPVRARAARSMADGEPRRARRRRAARGAQLAPRAGTTPAPAGDDLDPDQATDATTPW